MMTFLAVFSNILIGATVITLFLLFMFAVLEWSELDVLIARGYRKFRNRKPKKRMKL